MERDRVRRETELGGRGRERKTWRETGLRGRGRERKT